MADVLFPAARRRPGTGRAGITHCGSWTPVPANDLYGWLTRVVCVRQPHTTGRHRSRAGHTWRRGEQPRRPPTATTTLATTEVL